MRILYIWDADYPWDVRVEKICMTLLKYGHQVHVAARNLKALSEHENIDGLEVHRLSAFKNGSINELVSFPAFFSPIWKSFLNDLVVGYNIELIIVRDLPLALTAIWAGRRFNIPTIFDMAEDYLALIRDIWKVRKFQGFNLLVRNPYFVQLVERYALREANYTLVVIDEARDVVIKKGGNPRKIAIVGNTPPLASLRDHDITLSDTLRRIKDHFSVLYTGGIQMGRGIQTVFRAIPWLVQEIPNFLFVIVGDGYASDRLRRTIFEQGLQQFVLWVGWVSHANIFDYMRVSKIGLIPHITSDHVNTTIPNKIFDYMGLGLPVVASDAIPMKRILQETGSGISFKSDDHEDLARAILAIQRSGPGYGHNGIKAIREKYNWEEDEQRLIHVVNTFCK